MSRSLKKGPYVDPKLLSKIESMNTKGDKKVSAHLEPGQRYFPANGRSHDRCS